MTVRHEKLALSRKKLLDASLHVIRAKGYEATTVDDICAAAGLSKGSFFHHFKSKEHLYQAVVGTHVREFHRQAEEVLSAKGPAGPILLRYVSNHFDFIGTHPHYPRIFQRMMMVGDRTLERMVREHSIPLLKLLVALLERGMRSGEFRRLDQEHTIASIAALTVHYFNIAPAIRVISGQDPFSKANLARRKAAVLKFIRYALFRNPEAAEQ